MKCEQSKNIILKSFIFKDLNKILNLEKEGLLLRTFYFTGKIDIDIDIYICVSCNLFTIY